MSAHIAARMAELAGRHVPFVHATVVRAQQPTSAHAGDDAIVLADGSIEGFVGGQCAESRCARRRWTPCATGAALLLRVLPDGADAFPETPGALVVVNPCLSGGALEIFLRPVLPAPVVRVVGGTPIARRRGGAGRGRWTWRCCGDDVAGRARRRRRSSSRRTGSGEEAAIRAALDAGVGYVGAGGQPAPG